MSQGFGARDLRALGWLIQAQLLRIAREGLVVRALIWPGLLTALTLVISSTVVLAFYTDNELALEPGHPELVAQLEDLGLAVVEDPDPRALVDAEAVPRAAYQSEGQWVLATTRSGRLSLATEGVLREEIGANWRLKTPKPGARQVELGATLRVLVGMLGVLYALYGVVFGAAALSRDRASGSLDADLSLPIHRGVHALARILASTLALSAGIAITLGLLAALIGVGRPLAWWAAVTLAGASCTALGLAWMAASPGESLTGPLSRGMTLSLAAISLGFWQPELGRHLPLASMGAMVKGQAPSLVAWALCAALIWLACWIFDRSLR